MQVTKDLNENIKQIKATLCSSDVSFSYFTVNGKSAVLIFINDIVNKEWAGELILKPLTAMTEPVTEAVFDSVMLSPEKEKLDSVKAVVNSVVSGNVAVLIDGIEIGYGYGLKKFEKRSITEPPTSTVIKGPREGFVESLPTNVSMMRRRLKSPDLVFENLTVGRVTATAVSICYMRNVADKNLVNKLKSQIKNIDIDAVLDSSYIGKFLGEHKTSVFRQTGNTEKPDILSAKLLEGRVGILVDGSPIAITVPYLLIEDFQSPGDYYCSPYTASVSRVLRLFAVLLSILLPAAFVSAELFHLQLIPLSFLLTIINSIKGIPLSPSYEMFFTLIIFEILNEASVRMPKYVGMVVSIVGGLVLGETAVTAGIISAPTLMIVAFSGICLYTVPELEETFSVIRLLFLLVGGSLGIYGIVVMLVLSIIYLVSFENYGAPLMCPFSPIVKKDFKDSIYKGFEVGKAVKPKSLGK